MHVGLLTQLFPPEFAGGTEAVVLAQARALAERGHQVEVVSGTETPLPRGGAEVLHDVVGGVRVHRLPRTRAERAEGTGPLEVRPRIRDLALELLGGVDVAHLHHWANLDGSLVRALAPRAPVVVTLHDAFALCPLYFRHAPHGVPCPEERGAREPCARCLARATGVPSAELVFPLENRARAFAAELGAASLLLAPSEAHARRLAAFAARAIQVVPHGLCWPGTRLAQPPRPMAPNKLVVAHFGNLSADKGTLDLVHTLSLVPRERVELRLAGPVLDPEVERALAGHRRSNLLRIGAYDRETLAGFLAGSHVAAFPSRLEESYGLVVDEALALGLPAWVSARGAPAERLATWGLPGRLLPAGDPLAWAEALRSVLTAPHTLFAERARIPESLPTATDAARMLEDCYERALARRAA